MLKYLIIQLDDTSVAFCNYPNSEKKPNLIPLNILQKALFWSMTENLNVQILYPDHEILTEYKAAIDTIDHADIVASTCVDTDLRTNAEVVVFDSWKDLDGYDLNHLQSYVIRSTFGDLFDNEKSLVAVLPKVTRLNLAVTDIENFDAETQTKYAELLERLSVSVFDEYNAGRHVQLNFLTDRILLETMNNCGAGEESIALAPDGCFYICPAFYLDGSDPVGDLGRGLAIKNPQLYQLDHAPICRICDAWHCKRCILQNRNLTLEVNTPGREQCVISHIERNASRLLLDKIRTLGIFLQNRDIKVLNYLDPFDKLKEI